MLSKLLLNRKIRKLLNAGSRTDLKLGLELAFAMHPIRARIVFSHYKFKIFREDTGVVYYYQHKKLIYYIACPQGELFRVFYKDPSELDQKIWELSSVLRLEHL